MVKTPSNRLHYIDFFKGLFLIILTFDHIGGPLFNYTFETFGFVSAFEGFFFLSGFTYGWVYSKYTGNPLHIYKQTKLRVKKLYYYQTIVSLFAVCALFIAGLFVGSDYKSLAFNSVLSAVFSLGLLFQDKFLDILPLYILMLLIAPVVLKYLSKGKYLAVLISSFIIWIIGQFDLFASLTMNVAHIPFIKIGTFNVLSWQFLFVAGVLFGFNARKGDIKLPYRQEIIALFVLLFICFFIAKRVHVFNSILNNRENFTIFRLMNFAIIAYLVSWFLKKGYFVRSTFLELLGRNSLYLFALHIFLMYLLLIIPIKFEGLVFQISTGILFVFIMYLAAYRIESRSPFVIHQDLSNVKQVQPLMHGKKKYLLNKIRGLFSF